MRFTIAPCTQVLPPVDTPPAGGALGANLVSPTTVAPSDACTCATADVALLPTNSSSSADTWSLIPCDTSPPMLLASSSALSPRTVMIVPAVVLTLTT